MEFVNKWVCKPCLPHHELRPKYQGAIEVICFLVFVVIILLITFNSIEAIEKTVEPA